MNIRKACYIYENWEIYTVKQLAKNIDVTPEKVRDLIKRYGFRDYEFDYYPIRIFIYYVLEEFGVTKKNKDFLAIRYNLRISTITSNYNYVKRKLKEQEKRRGRNG